MEEIMACQLWVIPLKGWTTSFYLALGKLTLISQYVERLITLLERLHGAAVSTGKVLRLHGQEKGPAVFQWNMQMIPVSATIKLKQCGRSEVRAAQLFRCAHPTHQIVRGGLTVALSHCV